MNKIAARMVTTLAAGTLVVAYAGPASAHGGPGKGARADRAAGTHAGMGGRCGCRAGSTILSVDAAASALGVTSAALKADLKSGKTIAQIAAAAGKSVGDVAAALTTAAKAGLDAAVASGSLTRGQADAVLLGVPQQVAQLVSGTVRRIAGGRCGLLRLDIGVAASLLGITAADLRAQLNAGRTLAQIAAAAGKTLGGLGAAAADAAKPALDAAVAAGSLTQAQAQAILAGVALGG